jgi:diaminopimelate decarboxylase
MSDPAVLDLFPPGAAIDGDGELAVGGCRLRDLAAEFGTPAYVVDEAALRERAREYRDALSARWSEALVIFASKAFPCTAVLRAFAEEGLGCDVAGAGELVHALAAGVDPARIYLHGNAKTDEDLQRAIEAGVGTIVIDNLDDVDRLERLVSAEQAVLVRVIPGVRPDTHAAVATGQEDSKFGLAPADARRAIERVRGSDRLRLDGLHVHIGSQILDAAPFGQAVEALAALGEFAVYDLGGGLGARYTYADRPPTVAEYLDVLIGAAKKHLPPGARLVIEPGRSLVARAGVTLYTVVTVKRGARTFVAVDGGMADNLEVSLYGQRFEATVPDRVGGGEPVDLVGRHCESGDVLSAGVALREPRVGDVIAVPATGAYCFTMRNGYNGARRPPVVFVRDGDARVVVRREGFEDLLRLDV